MAVAWGVELGATWDTNSGTHTVTATPALSDLPVIVVCNDGNTATTAPTDNNTDGLGTYTLCDSALSRTSADIVLIFVRDHLIGSATSTVFTNAPGVSTGGGLFVERLTGMSKVGAAAIKRTGKAANITTGTTPAITWTGGGTPAGTNPMIGAIASGAAMTKPTTFDTERNDLNHLTPTRSCEVVTDDTGNTDTTVTWGSTVSGASGGVIVELDASSNNVTVNVATAGAITLTGQTIGLAVSLAVTAGAVTFTGQAIGLAVGLAITAGAVTFTGQTIGLRVALAVTAGAVTFTGQTVTIVINVTIAVTTAGAFTLTGQTIGLAVALAVTAGAIVWTGQTVTLVTSGGGASFFLIGPVGL